MHTLLYRNQRWSPAAGKYFADVVERFSTCHCTARVKPSTKVSLSTHNRNLNFVECVDHFLLDRICWFYAMDSQTRYSAGFFCGDTKRSTPVNEFEYIWIAPFWTSEAVQVVNAFHNPAFNELIVLNGIQFWLPTPRCHSKKFL